MKTVRNTISVLLVTALTALALYAGVQVAGADNGKGATTVAATAGQTYLCPVSGCSASTCHGATNLPAPTTTASTSDASSSGQMQTCPRTGCTASSCHGATGSPPPTSGQGGSGTGSGYGHRGYVDDGGTTNQDPNSGLVWQ